MDDFLTPQPRDPGGSASQPRLSDRIRAAWSLSKPRGILIDTSRAQREPIRTGKIERLQELLAGLAFVATFVSIVVEVFFRFALDRPLVWSLELPTYFFLWSFAFAAGLSDWRDDQIGFDLLARRLPEHLRLAGAAIANVLIIVPLAIVLPGTLSYLGLIGEQPNTGLPGSELWGYAGIIALFGIAVLLRARLLFFEVRDLVRLARGRRGAAA